MTTPPATPGGPPAAAGPSPLGRSVLLLWLAAALGAGALSLRRELAGRDLGGELAAALRLSEDERIARELARLERTHGFEEGEDAAVLAALRTHVPPDGNVYVVAERVPRNALTFSYLQVLLYPVRFHELSAVPPREATSGLTGKDFVLELHREPSPVLAGWFEEVAEGPGFRLWRHPEVGP